MKVISCIIPTKYRLDDLKETILSILAQNCDCLEIFVLDSNSDLEISKKISSFIQSLETKNSIVHVVEDFQSPCHARNKGIEISKGEYIALLDDDILLEPAFFENAIRDINDLQVAGVNGVNVLDNASLVSRLFYLGSFKDIRARKGCGGQPTKYLSTNCCILKREVFNEFKFDELYVGYSYAEDIDFSFRASKKYKFVICEDARLLHKASLKGRKPNEVYNNMKLYGTLYFYFKNLYPKEKLLFLLRLFPLALSGKSLAYFFKSYRVFLKYMTLQNPANESIKQYNSLLR